jgi:hypothetical protein
MKAVEKFIYEVAPQNKNLTISKTSNGLVEYIIVLNKEFPFKVYKWVDFSEFKTKYRVEFYEGDTEISPSTYYFVRDLAEQSVKNAIFLSKGIRAISFKALERKLSLRYY